MSLKDLKLGDCMLVEAKENKDDKLDAFSVMFGNLQPHSGMGNIPGMDMSE